MPRECTVDRAALLKIVLHAAKYPCGAVNGVLIGRVGAQAPPGASPPGSPRADGSGGDSRVHVYDAIPLCHNFISLAPMLECALVQVAEHVKQQQGEQKGLQIVGYYQANERLDDSELSGPGRRFADRIEALCPGAVALVLDAVALQKCLEGAEDQRPVLALYVKDGARGWTWAAPSSQLARFTCPSGGLQGLITQLTEEGRHRRLADFEDHLAGIKQDWLNDKLLE